MKKAILLFVIPFCTVCAALAQVKLYEDQFYGGVTGGSFSSGVSGTNSGTITLHIDPSSTIRKAYFIAGRLGPAPAATVNLNAMVLTLDASNQATPDFNCALYGGLSAVHAIDITSQVSPLVNVYNISYSQGGSGTNFFTDFYLYVAYENNSMSLVNTVIFLKTLDFIVTEQYTLPLTHPVDTLVPVGFAMHAGYMCDSTSDGENITIASTLVGNIGGGDPNNPQSVCAGTAGSFFYENNILFGLTGDSADQAMHGADALSDISSLVPNAATTFDVQFEHFGGGGSTADNSMWAWIMAYGNSNVQPVALFASPNHICPGTCTDFTNNSLNATSFQWSFPGASQSVSTDANPVSICYNSPGQYSVTLVAANANGSDTLMLPNYITVYPYPSPQGIAQSGDTLFANAGAVSYQWYHDGNLIPGATGYFYVASEGGDYNVVATDVNGCEVEAAVFDVIANVESLPAGEPALHIYVDPGKHALAISLLSSTGIPGIARITLYNMPGQKIFSTVERIPALLNLPSLTPGIYFVEAVAGSQVLQAKFLFY
jgi:hypothetical protein